MESPENAEDGSAHAIGVRLSKAILRQMDSLDIVRLVTMPSSTKLSLEVNPLICSRQLPLNTFHSNR